MGRVGAVVLCTSSGFSAYFSCQIRIIRRVIYLASENSYTNYFTRQKITHRLFGPEARGPLSKMVLHYMFIKKDSYFEVTEDRV